MILVCIKIILADILRKFKYLFFVKNYIIFHKCHLIANKVYIYCIYKLINCFLLAWKSENEAAVPCCHLQSFAVFWCRDLSSDEWEETVVDLPHMWSASRVQQTNNWWVIYNLFTPTAWTLTLQMCVLNWWNSEFSSCLCDLLHYVSWYRPI